MTKLLKTVAFLTAILTTTSAGARVWRVNPNPNSGAECQTVAQLQENYEFVAGDTILLDPGSHGSISLKRENITIMGPGYFLAQNEEFAMNNTATLSSLSLTKSSKAIGLYVNEYISLSNNCTVARCYCNGITNNNAISGCEIYDCFINGTISHWYISNSVIRNNIITGSLEKLSSVDVINNTLVRSVSGYIFGSSLADCTIQNNIFINSKEGRDSNGKLWAAYVCDFETLKNNNNNISYNVFSIPEANADPIFTIGNKYCGASVENTFFWEGSDDGKYRLKEGSPAKGASSNGGDCGAFGGALPYVLSGIPAFMPRITNASVPDSPTDGKISVTLTISTQNE